MICRHRLGNGDSDTQTINVRRGCHVPDVGRGEHAALLALLLAHDIGAISTPEYDSWSRILRHRGDDGDEIVIEVVDAMNTASIDGVWNFHDGGLCYQPPSWWREINLPAP